MYTAFFGLREKPFSLSPDPRFLFLSGSHREALAHLLYGIEQGEGFIAVTGEVGTGKTTLCRTLLRRLDSDVESAFLFNPKLGPKELLESILEEFDLKSEDPSQRGLVATLNAFLLEKRREGRRVLLILDEAQGLEAETLEQVRLLSNLETERTKLLQILLLGQPELDAMLETQALRQLRQRIGVRWRLSPLQGAETLAYVAHRLRVAAGGERNLFTRPALRAIHRKSGGIPRRINVIADRALLAAYAAGSPRVDRRRVLAAAAELHGSAWRLSRRAGRIALFSLLAVASTTLLWWQRDNVVRSFQRSAGAEARPPEFLAPEILPELPPLPTSLRSEAVPSDAATTQVALAPAPVAAPEPRLKRLREHLVASTIDASLLSATSNLMDDWGSGDVGDPGDLAVAIARIRGLGLGVYSFSHADLSLLRQLDHPALLRLHSGHVVTLRAIDDERVLLTGLGDRAVVQGYDEIAEWWAGEAHVVWSDVERLPGIMRVGSRGDGVTWLQEALIELGFLGGTPSGYFDAGTAKALQAFQGERSLPGDGQVGPLTKMALYRSLSRYSIPRLSDGIPE